MSEQQKEVQRHKRLAMEAAKRMGTTNNKRRTLSTWARHMKAYIKGAQ